MEAKLVELIQQLASLSQQAREQARASLRAEGAAAIPALFEALRHAERDIRVGAALTLGELGASQAATALAEMARADPDPSARPLALRALCELAHPGCPEAIRTALLAALTDKDLFSRALACKGLGRIGDTACREALAASLKDPEDWVRQAAREALAALPAAPPSAASGGPGGRPSAALMTRPPAGPLRPSPADAWLGQLASLDLTAQRQAQEGLRGLGAQAVPRVAPLLKDTLPHVRRAAIEVLGAIAAPAGLEPLEELLASPEPGEDLRAMALHAVAETLLRRGSDAATADLVELLRQHLQRDDPFVRGAAAAALMAASPADRGPLLEHLHEEDEEWIRVAAARALAQVAGPAETHLIALLLDELAQMTDPTGQRHLLEAMRGILARSQTREASAVVGPVSFFLSSPHAEVQDAAVRLLARAIHQPDARLLRTFLDLLTANPEDPELVTAVARLAAPGDAAAAPALSRALRSRSEAAAGAAARALATIGGRQAVEALVEVANARAGRATALAAQALASLDATAQQIAIRRADGRWERRLQLRCSVDRAELRFVEREGREELRCPRCDREYALSAAEKLFPAERTAFGLCLCRSCRRKQPLVRKEDSETLVCPASGEVHIRPFDHPNQLRLLSSLPLGACCCCAEPQPLVRVGEEVRCYRSRQLYRAGPRGFERADEPAPVAEDVGAINRALLLGTLGIAESGLAASQPAGPRIDEGGDPEER